MQDWHKPEPRTPADDPQIGPLIVGCVLVVFLAAGIVYGLLKALGVV